MAEMREVPFHEFIRLHDRTWIRRWRTGLSGGSSQRHVAIGHRPDRSWCVDDTGQTKHGWLFTAPTSAEARSAAEQFAAELMRDGVWERAIATHDPRNPGQELQVPEWPAGHEPPTA